MPATIQAILFDADGVIVSPAHQFIAYQRDTLHLPDEWTQSFFGKEAFYDCLVGKADLKEAIAPFLRRWGWRESVDAYLQRWFEVEHHIDPRLLPFVEKCRQRGIYCGIATNQEMYRLHYMRTQMGFDRLFDGVFGSAMVGAMKPDPAFYQYINNRIVSNQQNVLFIDDSLKNVIGARTFGWQAEHYRSFEDWPYILDKYKL